MAAIRASVVEAATRLLQRGDELTVDGVAAEAGISRSTLYRHLGGRAGLFRVLADEGAVSLDDEQEAPARERLLAAAAREVGRLGPFGVTLESIAAAAGLSAMTLYREFGDRAGLLRALSERLSPRSEVSELLAEGRPLEDALVPVAARMLAFLRQNPGLVAGMLTSSPEERASMASIHRAQDATRRTLLRFFAARQEAGELGPGDPAVLVRAFMGQVLGFALVGKDLEMGAAGADEAADADDAVRIVALFLDGARQARGRSR